MSNQAGFAIPNQTPNLTTVPQGGSDYKKADAFINLSLPRADGSTGKVDRGLRLYFDSADQKGLAELLQTPEGIERFRSALVITCNYANVEKAGFAV